MHTHTAFDNDRLNLLGPILQSRGLLKLSKGKVCHGKSWWNILKSCSYCKRDRMMRAAEQTAPCDENRARPLCQILSSLSEDNSSSQLHFPDFGVHSFYSPPTTKSYKNATKQHHWGYSQQGHIRTIEGIYSRDVRTRLTQAASS